jgi:hypothetical protein
MTILNESLAFVLHATNCFPCCAGAAAHGIDSRNRRTGRRLQESVPSSISISTVEKEAKETAAAATNDRLFTSRQFPPR